MNFHHKEDYERTSFLSKVIESACLKQFNTHLNKVSALQKLQLAVRKVYNDLIINESRGKDTILVLLDLSPNFDTIDQN